MVHEIFYKFFIGLKRMVPELRFIIAGDFEQLLPVKDRLGNCYHAHSLALNESCDGNRLILSKCRRSNDTSYNMLLPQNIENTKIIKQTNNFIYKENEINRKNKFKREMINNILNGINNLESMINNFKK